MQLAAANRHNAQAPGPALRNRFSPRPSTRPCTRFRTLYSVLRTPYPLPTYNLNCRMMTKRAKMRAQPAKVTVVVS